MSWLSGLLGPSKPETLESLLLKVEADNIGFGHIRIQDWVLFVKNVVNGPIRASVEGAIRPETISTYSPQKIASELRFLQERREKFITLDLGIYPYLDPKNTEVAKKIRVAVLALFDAALKELMVAARKTPAPTPGQAIAANFAARLDALKKGGKRKTKKRKQSKRRRRHTRK